MRPQKHIFNVMWNSSAELQIEVKAWTWEIHFVMFHSLTFIKSDYLPISVQCLVTVHSEIRTFPETHIFVKRFEQFFSKNRSGQE
jgi:hypothetical protein